MTKRRVPARATKRTRRQKSGPATSENPKTGEVIGDQPVTRRDVFETAGLPRRNSQAGVGAVAGMAAGAVTGAAVGGPVGAVVGGGLGAAIGAQAGQVQAETEAGDEDAARRRSEDAGDVVADSDAAGDQRGARGGRPRRSRR